MNKLPDAIYLVKIPWWKRLFKRRKVVVPMVLELKDDLPPGKIFVMCNNQPEVEIIRKGNWYV